MMNIEQINKKLLEVQTAWFEQIAKPYCESHTPESFSAPFCCGIAQYDESKPTMMIVGQEAKWWYKFTDKRSLEFMQNTSIQYFEIQFGLREGKKNNSFFWHWMKYFSGYNAIWNNLDKIHGYDEEGNSTTLPNAGVELKIGKRFSDGKSLLQKEIEIIKPDIILFFTGPNYDKSMAYALGLDASQLQAYKPTQPEPVTNISKLTSCAGCVLWSYHPTHLNKKHLNEKAEDTIQKNIAI